MTNARLILSFRRAECERFFELNSAVDGLIKSMKQSSHEMLNLFLLVTFSGARLVWRAQTVTYKTAHVGVDATCVSPFPDNSVDVLPGESFAWIKQSAYAHRLRLNIWSSCLGRLVPRRSATSPPRRLLRFREASSEESSRLPPVCGARRSRGKRLIKFEELSRLQRREITIDEVIVCVLARPCICLERSPDNGDSVSLFVYFDISGCKRLHFVLLVCLTTWARVTSIHAWNDTNSVNDQLFVFSDNTWFFFVSICFFIQIYLSIRSAFHEYAFHFFVLLGAKWEIFLTKFRS